LIDRSVKVDRKELVTVTRKPQTLRSVFKNKTKSKPDTQNNFLVFTPYPVSFPDDFPDLKVYDDSIFTRDSYKFCKLCNN